MCSSYQFSQLRSKSPSPTWWWLEAWEGHPQLWRTDAPAAGASPIRPHPSKLAASVALVTEAQEDGRGEGHSGQRAERQLVLSLWLPTLGLANAIDKRDFIFPFPSCLLSFRWDYPKPVVLSLFNPGTIPTKMPVSFLIHSPLSSTPAAQLRINLCCGESGFCPRWVLANTEEWRS